MTTPGDPAPPNSAARSVNSTFSNYTTLELARKSASLDHGIWTTNMYPPEKISPSGKEPTVTKWESESEGFLTGTEGNVVYGLPDGQTTVTLTWDNPYIGKNSYNIEIKGPQAIGYIVHHDNDSSDNATVEFSIRRFIKFI